jgi:asparagine synthase (glutamine-hydrolysing)
MVIRACGMSRAVHPHANMCGIAGFAHRDRQYQVPGQIMRVMCDAIRHRGPDDEGIFISGPVGIGMRRLSIIDLAGGHQPISNETGLLNIVFNGEIYNYAEIRKELIERGHVFKTNSDTETILHLFEDVGPDCVRRLRGMFTIHDARDGSLFLARDRFGIKPLYIAENGSRIAFASELKALIAAGLTDRALDWEALDAYFELGYIPAPASPFRDVRKLEPGFWLQWHPENVTKQAQYWDLPTQTESAPKDIEERVLGWLDDSVKAHLVSDVPIAAFLSGGIDSSAIVSSMALQSGASPHAFTARYLGSGAEGTDETGLARLLANRYGAKLTVVDVAPQVRDIFEPIIRTLDEPHADESAIPSWVLSQAIAAEYKVALAGTGGDELFAGYRRHIGLPVGEYYGRLPRSIQRLVSTIADAIPEPAGGELGVDRLKRFVRSNEGPAWQRYLAYFSRLPWVRRQSLYAGSVRDHVAGNSAARWFESFDKRGGSLPGIRAGLYLDYKTYLPDDILALSDRISMAHSLEVRVPFVDHELIGHVYPLPDRTKIGAGKAKQLLRRAVRNRLPAEHFSAPKRGFVGPSASWLRNELREMITDELSADRMTRLGLFDPATVTGLMDEHFAGRHNRSGILWELLCFTTWHRLLVEDSTPALLELLP